MSDRFTVSSDCQALLLGGSKGGRRTVTQWPMWGKGFPVVYQAENGRILWVWENPDPEVPPTEKEGSMSIRDCLFRVNALNEMIIKSSEDPRFNDMRHSIGTFVNAMVDIIREAREQGEPFDSEAIAERRRRRPKTFIMPRVIEGV